MGTQNVPRTVVLCCNGRTYGNAYLITLKIEPLRSHALAIVRSISGKLLLKSSRLLRFDVHYGCEICLRRVQWLGYHRKVLNEELLHNKRCVARCVIVMHETLSLPLTAPLAPNCIARPLQNLHVRIASNVLSRRYELTVHQPVDVKEFRELFDCPSYTLL
jgi:hypothetical protein